MKKSRRYPPRARTNWKLLERVFAKEKERRRMTLKKETTLSGLMATGDYESFCFGKFGPGDHWEHMQEHHPWPETSEELGEAMSQEEFDPVFVSEHLAVEYADFCAGLEAREAAEAEIRVYPNDLLPEGHGGRKGRWKITVEFWPEPELVSCEPVPEPEDE